MSFPEGKVSYDAHQRFNADKKQDKHVVHDVSPEAEWVLHKGLEEEVKNRDDYAGDAENEEPES